MRGAGGIQAASILAWVSAAAIADAAEIKVYSTGAPAAAVQAIAADFAKSAGHHLSFTIGQPATIESDLAAGERPDLVIVPSPVIARLNGGGVLRADSAVNVARVGIGVVVRAGAPRPNIADAAAIRRLLIAARSIVYPDPKTGGGSAGRAVAYMIDQMGVADIVKPKLTLASAIGGGVELVASGKVEVGFFNISEILPIHGVTLVGPLPAQLQSYIVFGAAIPKSNTMPEPANAFIKRLIDPASREAWRKSGMEPVTAAAR